MNSDLSTLAAAFGVDLSSLARLDTGQAMEEGDISLPDSPVLESGQLSPGQSAFEKQRASLQTYLDSVPYKCESIEEMQQVLEDIVGKISICAQTKNWLVLATWDGMMQWSVNASRVTRYYVLR